MLFMNNNGNKFKFVCWFLGIAGGLIGLIIFANSSGILESMTSVEAFQKYIKGFGNKAGIIFFIIQFASVIFAPIPSNISTAAAGMIFGMWETFYISTGAILLGSTVVFILARKLGKPFTDRFVNPKIATGYGQLIASKGDILLVLVFFLPFFPDDAICFLAGLSKMKLSKFFIITLLTRPWGILGASAVGSADIVVPWWGWVAIALITAILYIFVSNYRKKIEDKLIAE